MNTKKPKVMVLMSTYNGTEYLREQLDSLIEQEFENIQLVIRDDGSSDDTVSILKEYSDSYQHISYYEGDNLGPIGSFFDLMEHVKDEEFDYVALCDQDDYWLPQKIKRAVAWINKVAKKTENSNSADKGDEKATTVPLLYCGKPLLVDSDLKPFEKEIKRKIRPGFSNALVENIVTGCTAVMNRSMYELAIHFRPAYCIMHDWWLYLLATCFGHVIYDSESYIYYRQHSDNAMGIEHSRSAEIKQRTKKFKDRQSNICIQAAEFVRLLKDKPEFVKMDDRVRECYKRADLLSHYKKGFNRFRLVFGRKVYRQRLGDHLIFYLLFLLGLR